MEVVAAGILMLFVLNILDREGLSAGNFRNELQSVYHGSSIPIDRKFSHLYVTCTSRHVLFTRPEPLKLDRHLTISSPKKLYDGIKKARPDQAYETTRVLLVEISRICTKCQTYSAPL